MEEKREQKNKNRERRRKRRIESSGDVKVNSSLKNYTFFKSYTIIPDRKFSGTLKYRRVVTEIP